VLPSGGGGAERERMEAFLHRLKRLDAYPKVNEDFYKRTLSGGVVTVVAAVLMMLLFISETS
jgi:endoplasmic reticulum-Golgi intermediate compartment protein 3